MGVLLELHHAWVVFATQNGTHEALRGVSLAVSEGEWVCILGANGSGKSTLGKVLTGLCDLSSGQIEFLRSDVSVRMVFQNPEAQAIGQTVWEDVCYQPSLPTSADISTLGQAALNRVGLSANQAQDVQTLSGGQKQRLAIAASITGQTDLLVMDEATTMLDGLNRSHIWSTTQTLNQLGQTVVWITQHLDEVQLASRVVVLEKGIVAFDGKPTEFFYPEHADEPSTCERLGFDPPLSIRIARNLMRNGYHPHPLPLNWDNLQRSVGIRAVNT